MQQPTDDVYANARQIVFKAGGMVSDHEVHLLLDELLGMLSYLEDRDQQRLADLKERAETIRSMQQEADTFDSVLASNILRHFAEQNERLSNITSALARLGAVVEGGDEG